MCQVRERLCELPRQPSPALHLGGQPTPGAELLVRQLRLNRAARRLIQNLVLVHQSSRTAAQEASHRTPRTRPRHRDRTARCTRKERQHLISRSAQEPLLLELRLLGRDRILVLTLRTESRPVTRRLFDRGLDLTLHRVQIARRLPLVGIAPRLRREREVSKDLRGIRTVVLLVQVSRQRTILVDVTDLRSPAPRILRSVVRHDASEVLTLIQGVQVVTRRLLLLLAEERVIERRVVAVLRRAPLPASRPSWCAPLLSECVICPGERLPGGKLTCGRTSVPPRARCTAPRRVLRNALLLLIQPGGAKAASRRPSVPPSRTSTHMNSSERR